MSSFIHDIHKLSKLPNNYQELELDTLSEKELNKYYNSLCNSKCALDEKNNLLCVKSCENKFKMMDSFLNKELDYFISRRKQSYHY